MKKSKKNYLIIALVVILLCLAIGYAAFTANLTINGTATGKTTWSVKFTDASITAGHGDVTLGDDEVVVNAELAYPGDGCEVTVNITNEGSLAAKLTDFKFTAADGTEFSNDNITITTPTMTDDIIAAGETCPFTFAIKWNEDSTETTVSANFSIAFEYTQSTESVDVNASHGSHSSN